MQICMQTYFACDKEFIAWEVSKQSEELGEESAENIIALLADDNSEKLKIIWNEYTSVVNNKIKHI